uniref:ArfGAP with SH3 domain, ankyrin repeat and PH domain 2a n=1 Tax=Labrus bergylta TaxID=56723 RepID=A0A3Q3FES0_9LABR
MPDQITVSEFVAETNEDYKSPTASNFTTRMSHCRNTVTALEEVIRRKDTSALFPDSPTPPPSLSCYSFP